MVFNAALRAIIDLLKLRKDVRKTDLEIDKLEREGRNAEALIQRASFEDLQKYDPKTRQSINLARDLQRRRKQGRINYARGLSWFLGILLLLAVLYAIYRFFG